MKKVILQEFVSVDGLAAGPNDSVDFIPASMQGDQPFGQHQTKFLDSIDTILLGRVTYEMFAAHWPNVTSGPDEPFADKLNAIPRIVFSTTLDRAPWGSYPDAKVVKSSAAKEVARLRQGSGKDMVMWGSLSLAQSLMREALIDEYQLIICPVVLGTGRPLFAEQNESIGMQLVSTKSFDRGSVLLVYTANKGQ
ncbi:MAG TPA: dihydrofolate reductase family protein [Gemmatimonadaceae bacterium]|nr:dihydrofolate reductase family protein [Gemmatimonadaceae bacterium]